MYRLTSSHNPELFGWVIQNLGWIKLILLAYSLLLVSQIHQPVSKSLRIKIVDYLLGMDSYNLIHIKWLSMYGKLIMVHKYQEQQSNNQLIFRIFRLNWAIYGGGTKPYLLGPSKSVQQISIYVGDLDPSVTDNILLDFFKEKYPSVFSAKIICDSVTKYSKGYGFVKFHNSEQAQKAITDVNGTLLKGKMIKTAPAYNKNSTDNAYADINLPEDPEKQYLAMVQKQQVLQYYYSLINDPLAKLEYQKQLEQMYGFDITKQPKKKSLKSDLESIRSLQYSETVSSQPFLENLPKMIAYKSKMTVENRIFQ